MIAEGENHENIHVIKLFKMTFGTIIMENFAEEQKGLTVTIVNQNGISQNCLPTLPIWTPKVLFPIVLFHCHHPVYQYQ